MSKPTITLHLVSSLDGFIASKDNTVAWMDTTDAYEKGVVPDYSDVPPIDCYILGSRTYEHALELGWPYADTPTYVLTSRTLPSARATVHFHSGDLTSLFNQTLAPNFENIWMVGGAALAQSFLQLNLVDELRLMIAPITLGSGLPLFGNSLPQQEWHLKNVIAYKNGYLDLSYMRRSTV